MSLSRTPPPTAPLQTPRTLSNLTRPQHMHTKEQSNSVRVNLCNQIVLIKIV